MKAYCKDQPPRIEILDSQDRRQEELRALADWIARLLDTWILIPGTSIRVGLDPLLGLIPILGDAVANLVGSTILLLAIQLHIPKIVILRMALNIGINTLIGVLPGMGDLFSIWYRSNLQNAALLRHYTTRSHTRATIGDWIFVSLLILILFSFTITILALGIFAIQAIWSLLR